MAESSRPRLDPRFRPYRVAAYALYLAIVGTFSLAIIISVVRSTISMTPARPPVGAGVLSPSECLRRAQALWLELEKERNGLSRLHKGEIHADRSWVDFRIDWLRRHREAESLCAVSLESREALRRVYAELDHVMDLYTTHAVQFSGEVGPGVSRLHLALERAREDESSKR